MFLEQSHDFIIPSFVPYLGIPITLGLFILVSLIEAPILRRMIPNSRAWKDSFLMNIVSTLLGWVPSLLIFVYKSPHPIKNTNLNGEICFLGGWIVSVLSEGFVLKILERQSSSKRIFFASILANSLSYIVIVLIYYAFVIITQIDFF
jgi:zinc transporter ZupT